MKRRQEPPPDPHLSSCVVLLLLLTATPILASAPPLHTPRVAEAANPHRTAPVWVSAEAATAADRVVAWDLFEAADRRLLQNFLAQNTEARRKAASTAPSVSDPQAIDCPLVLGPQITEKVDPKPNDSLRALVTHARAIVAGEVVGIEQGFLDGLPASLVQVRPKELLRLSRHHLPEALYIGYQHARFKIGDATFCTGANAAFVPAVGDQVLLFVYRDPIDRGGTIFYPDPEEVIFASADGKAVLPHSLQTDPEVGRDATFSELIATTAKAIGTSPKPPGGTPPTPEVP